MHRRTFLKALAVAATAGGIPQFARLAELESDPGPDERWMANVLETVGLDIRRMEYIIRHDVVVPNREFYRVCAVQRLEPDFDLAAVRAKACEALNEELAKLGLDLSQVTAPPRVGG